MLAAREAARLTSDHAEVLAFLAEIETEAGNHDEAYRAAEQSIALRPDIAEGHHAMGLMLLNRKKWRLAEEQFRRVLEIDAEDFHAMNNLGIALLNQSRRGKRNEAIELFTRAAKLDPKNELVRTNLTRGMRRTMFGGFFIVLWVLFRLMSGMGSGAEGFVLLLAAFALIAVMVRAFMKYRKMPPEARLYFKARAAKLYLSRLWLIFLLGGGLTLALLTAIWINDSSTRPTWVWVIGTVAVLGGSASLGGYKLWRYQKAGELEWRT